MATSFAASALPAAAANAPCHLVLAGLSTNPVGRQVTSPELLELVRSVRSAIGLWPDMTQAGEACRSCNKAQPQVVVEFPEQPVGLAPSRRPGTIVLP